MPRVWKKVPLQWIICQCGCGRKVKGTSRRKYATDYCKLKVHLARKKLPDYVPYDVPRRPKPEKTKPIWV